MDPAGGMDLASAPPLPDGGPSPPAARGGPRRGGGGRGRGFRRGPHGAPHGVSPRSASMVRWQTLRRQIVTIGDDVCLVPTQLISLSQLVSDCIVAEREERQGGPSVAGHKQQKEGPSPTQQEGGVAPKVQNGVQQEQQQPGGPLPANSSSEAPAAAAAGGEESLGRSSKDNRGAAVDLDSKVISLIVECAARLPIKSGIYAALVGLLYRKARLRGWVSSLVTAAGARFESSLRQGLFTDAKLLLRFFFGLASSHVLSLVKRKPTRHLSEPRTAVLRVWVDGLGVGLRIWSLGSRQASGFRVCLQGPVIAVIKALLQMANELPSTTAEHAAHTAMSALPWLSVKMYESDHASLVEALDCPDTKLDGQTLLLLSAVQPFTGPLAAAAARAPEALGGPLDLGGGPQDPADSNAVPSLKPTDRLASLLDAIDAMIDAEWHSRATLRFYQSSELQPLLSGEGPGAPPLIDLPPLGVGAPELRQLRVPPLEPILRLPATLEHVDVPLQPHDRWILEDHVLTTLRHFISNISLCAEQLLRIPVDHPQFEYVLVECVFSEMLRMPRSPVVKGPSGAPFAYSRLLQRLCQLQNSVGSVVEVLLSSLVRRAYDLDHEALLVLSEFFGYWLNAWGGPSKLLDEWLGVAKAPPPTKLFVRLSLEKAMRINYPDALALSLPESAKDLSPPRAVADNPYLCLTPASANGAPQGAPSGSNDSAQEAAGGGGAGPSQGGGGPPLGLVEFSLLRQLLKFSFGSQDAKQANVLQVHKLLSSLVGQHKSKWTRPPQGGPQEAQAGALPSNDSEAAKARKEADAEGGMDTDSPAADGASAEAAANAAGEAAAARGDEEAMEEEGSSTSPAHAIDWRALEQSERALESPPWDLAEVVRMLVICLLALGSKTQTHLHRLLSNYAPVFCLLEQQGAEGKAVVSDQQVDVHPAALQALQKYWANSQQKMALSLHAFIKVGILKRPNVLQLLCAASPEVRDSWAHLELIQTVLRGAIDDCETAKDEAEASGAPVPPAAEAEELLHTYLSCLLLDLKGEELRSRSRFLFLRCLFIGRKYAEYINLPRLQEEVGSGDPRLQSLWTIIAQVRRQFYFLDEEGALQ